MENLLYNYFNDFFTASEKNSFLSELNYKSNVYLYQNGDLAEWIEVENSFKSLLPCGNLDDFHLEINKNATTFIDLLFNKYIDSDTFVVGIREHDSIKKNMDKVENNLMFLTDDLINHFDITQILTKYKNSGKSKMFIYAAGIIESNVVPQEFYIELKNALTKEQIEHIFILDDVQGMFIIPRDYSLFDKVIFTCHSLIPHYNSGILLSKVNENMGYIDVKPLKDFIYLLKASVLKNLNKMYLFKFMIEQFLFKELQYKELFYEPPRVSYNVFFLCIRKERAVKLIINKYKEDLAKYAIDFYENTFMVKSNFVLQLSPEQIVEGFSKLKKILQKIIKTEQLLEANEL